MPDVFSPIKIKGLEIQNRFMRSATYDALADDQGRVTDASVALYKDLAQGGVGLIMTGHSFVNPLGQSGFRQYGIYSDDLVPGLKRLVQVAHAGGAKIAPQITHCGINSNYHARKGTTAVGPSVVETAPAQHRALTETEIEGIITDFGAAAVRAREAGFDGVQLHGAHGYLMSEFFSPLYNRRTDKWGGSPENRRRFHLEVIKEVRRRVGNDFPLFMKFGVMEEKEGGVPLEEGIAAAKAMVAVGLDAIEISAGADRMGRGAVPAGEAAREAPYFRERTAAAKRALKVPVMEVGGIRTLAMARELLNAGEADMVSLSRPFIREPGLVARWQREAEHAAKCISCNRCFWMIEKEGGLACYRERHPEATD